MKKQFYSYLSLFVALQVMPSTANATSEVTCAKPKELTTKWSGGEHIFLADKGFRRACAGDRRRTKYCRELQIPRKDNAQTYSYGQISALGDFYLDPEGPWTEEGDTHTEYGSEKMFKCMNSQGEVFEEQKEHPEVKMPDCTWTYIVNSKTFLYVVSQNTKHFAWHNMKAYVKVHQWALKEAVRAHDLELAGNPKDSDEALRSALYLGAFADHYLTDSFPAGHVRVPRQQIKDWAKNNLSGLFKAVRGEALSMVLHDNEGKNRFEKETGLEVINSNGDQWNTHSDGRLHECTQDDEPGINLPTQAVTLSVKEILHAYRYGLTPVGVYAATNLVPFPARDSLADKYNSRMKIEGKQALAKRLYDKLPTALKLLTSKNDVSKLLGSLPSLMEGLAKSVNADLATGSILQKRLPKKYLEAFKRIQ